MNNYREQHEKRKYSDQNFVLNNNINITLKTWNFDHLIGIRVYYYNVDRQIYSVKTRIHYHTYLKKKIAHCDEISKKWHL